MRNRIGMIVVVLVLLLVTYQLNCILYNSYTATYYKQHEKLLQLIALVSANKNHRKPRKPQEFWVAPGRTRARWNNFVEENMPPSEWGNNF